MPGSFTDHANNSILDLLFGGKAFAPPAVFYVGLSLAPPNRLGFVVEPPGGGYARAALPNVPGAFTDADQGTKTNAVPVSFPAPEGDWGTARSVFLADAPEGGNVLAMGDVVAPKRIEAGAPAPRIAPGAISILHY